MALKEYEFQTDAVNRLADAYYANKKNVILEAPTGSEKATDESTDKTAETEETPKKRKKHWWQFGRGLIRIMVI